MSRAEPDCRSQNSHAVAVCQDCELRLQVPAVDGFFADSRDDGQGYPQQGFQQTLGEQEPDRLIRRGGVAADNRDPYQGGRTTAQSRFLNRAGRRAKIPALREELLEGPP